MLVVRSAEKPETYLCGLATDKYIVYQGLNQLNTVSEPACVQRHWPPQQSNRKEQSQYLPNDWAVDLRLQIAEPMDLGEYDWSPAFTAARAASPTSTSWVTLAKGEQWTYLPYLFIIVVIFLQI